MDFLYDRIFNKWVLLLFVTGMSYTMWTRGMEGMIEAALSAAAPLLVLFPLYMIGVLGAGDIKLLAAVGSFFTVLDMAKCLILSFIIGAVFSLLKMLAEKNFLQRMQYLMSYFYEVFKYGKWKLYEQDIQDRKERNQGKIHFALPVLLSVMLIRGGIY